MASYYITYKCKRTQTFVWWVHFFEPSELTAFQVFPNEALDTSSVMFTDEGSSLKNIPKSVISQTAPKSDVCSRKILCYSLRLFLFDSSVKLARTCNVLPTALVLLPLPLPEYFAPPGRKEY